MINLGDKAKDLITGFEGIVTQTSVFLYGCAHIGITPTVLKDDGSVHKMQSFDEQRIEVTQKAAVPSLNQVVEPAIKLGNKARDTISGFEGTVIAIIYFPGSTDLWLEPPGLDKDGAPKKPQSFDVKRVELIAETKPEVSKDAVRATSGGPVTRAP